MPGQFENILDKLQRKLGKQTIRKASTIARPKPRPDVIQMQAINDFMRRNPRAYGGLIKQGPQKGKHRFFVGRPPNVRNFYADTIEEGKAWEKKTRTKKGYDKPFGKTIPKSELNKGAQYFFEEDFDDLTTDAKGTKEKKKSKVYSKIRDHHRRTGKYKFVVKTQDKPLTESQQAKIKKQFPNAKFGPKRKLGFAPSDPEYFKVSRFIERGYKKPYEGGKFKSLTKYQQQELTKTFPEVDFNFDRSNVIFSKKGATFSKYGVPFTHPKYSRISKFFNEVRPIRY